MLNELKNVALDAGGTVSRAPSRLQVLALPGIDLIADRHGSTRPATNAGAEPGRVRICAFPLPCCHSLTSTHRLPGWPTHAHTLPLARRSTTPSPLRHTGCCE